MKKPSVMRLPLIAFAIALSGLIAPANAFETCIGNNCRLLRAQCLFQGGGEVYCYSVYEACLYGSGCPVP